MNPTRKKKRSRGPVGCAGAALALLLSVTAGRPAVAAPADEDAVQGRPRADLYALPGALLAESDALPPVGRYRIVRYRVEELALSAPVTAQVGGQEVRTDKAWRVTLFGGPFIVRAIPPMVWIDEAAFMAREGRDLGSVSVVVFDRSLLKEGATLAFSYGRGESFTRLPQKLSFQSASR